jgi:hypothetical protein
MAVIKRWSGSPWTTLKAFSEFEPKDKNFEKYYERYTAEKVGGIVFKGIKNERTQYDIFSSYEDLVKDAKREGVQFCDIEMHKSKQQMIIYKRERDFCETRRLINNVKKEIRNVRKNSVIRTTARIFGEHDGRGEGGVNQSR